MEASSTKSLSEAQRRKTLGRIIVKCWTDPAFKRGFLADPSTCLKGYGLPSQPGERFVALENTSTKKHIVIHRKVVGDLNFDQYKQLAMDAAKLMSLGFAPVGKRAKVILKCWSDPDFLKALTADPVAALKGEGIEVPDGIQLEVFVNEGSTTHIVLPQAPARELSIEDLNKAATRAGGKRFGFSELPTISAAADHDPENDPDNCGTDQCDYGDSEDSDVCCLCICA